MRDTPTSNCERDFILKLVEQPKLQRLDGRDALSYRPLTVGFGRDYGRSHVCLGRTRVMAQVSCSVVPPKQARPNEGELFVNVEMSPMACPSWDASSTGRPGNVQLSRQLERCFKESKCIDVESLCIVAEEKVWQIRIDVHVLNYEGNLLDCASVAAISALAHFRRPDFTVDGSNVIIHKPEEKETIPLTVLHMPIAVSFALIQNGKFMLLDPSLIEEKVMDGLIVVAMNKHREICSLHVSGTVTIHRDMVQKCTAVAASQVEEITERIQSALKQDTITRAKGLPLPAYDGMVGEPTACRTGGRPRSAAAAASAAADEDMSSEDMDESGASSTDVASMSSMLAELGRQPSKAARVAKCREPRYVVAHLGTARAKGAAIGGGGPSTWDLELPSAAVTSAVPQLLRAGRAGDDDSTAAGGSRALQVDSDSEEEVTVELRGGEGATAMD